MDREPSYSSSTPRLLFVLHAHQPTGNVEKVFEQAHDACYAPIVGMIERFPAVRMALHFSGPLLEWIESRRADTIALLRGLASRGQVEIVGGGWQEPMLSSIPPRDALGQLRLMRYECARLFGAMPRGMWLAERAWAPDLPAVIREAGYEWTLVDDTHLRFAGILDGEICGWWATEKWGKMLAVFPIARSLRYAIPFREPEETVRLLATRPGSSWTYGDDAEKFGLWPGTREWVWDKGWLERFMSCIASAQDSGALRTEHPSRVMATEPSSGRIYLPTCSYHEMGEWSLPAAAGIRLAGVVRRIREAGMEEEAGPFVRGGYWDGFLAKYPESNFMHKHMLRVSDKVARAEQRDLRSGLGAAGGTASEARRELYRSQTNCAYWHGLFGGLYLPHLRRALWLHMLRAENLVDPEPEGGIRLTTCDLDCDGDEEIVVETGKAIFTAAPSQGGCLIEAIHRPTCLNLVDTMARRPEIYHSVESSHAGDGRGGEERLASIHDIDRTLGRDLERKLVYDAVPRRGFQEMILPAGADPSGLESRTCPVLADLASCRWRAGEASAGDGKARIALETEVSLPGGRLRVSKRYVIRADEARVGTGYALSWDGERPLDAILAVAWNLNLLAGDAPDRYHVILDPPIDLGPGERILASRGSWPRVARWALVDEYERVRVTIETSPVCTMHRHPVETVSQSEDGFQLTYQGTCMTCAWPLGIESWVEWKGKASLGMESLGG